MSNATAVSVIAAMMTPALLILASASLVGSPLVRMARIVDRARALAAGARTVARLGDTPELLHSWLDRHAIRTRYAELSIALLYSGIVVFTATCLSIVLDGEAHGILAWLPVVLAIGGTLLLLTGGACLMVEPRLSWAQIHEEICHARARLKEGTPCICAELLPLRWRICSDSMTWLGTPPGDEFSVTPSATPAILGSLQPENLPEVSFRAVV